MDRTNQIKVKLLNISYLLRRIEILNFRTNTVLLVYNLTGHVMSGGGKLQTRFKKKKINFSSAKKYIND